MSDLQERGNAPSGSGFPGYALCNGKWQIESVLPEPPSNDFAESGNLIHAALSGEKVSLTEEQEEVRILCEVHRGMTQEELGMTEPDVIVTEKRYWYRDDQYSGQIDGLFIKGETAWVFDYKTGRNPVSGQSLQLMAYAVLVKYNFNQVKQIYCSIIQPLCGKPTSIFFDQADLEKAEKEIDELLLAIHDPEAMRTPGEEQCRYCRAIGVCPEAKSLTIMVEKLPTFSLTNEQIAALLPILPVVEKQSDEIKRMAKERLIAGETITGYTLKEGRQTRTIPDAEGAFNLLSDKLSPEAFASVCKVSVSSLEKVWGEATGTKGKVAKESLESTLGDFITISTGEPMLAKAKAD